ncbi:hypothetical protein NDU88_003186 [Pleurodeles waltl]|uniref:Uncharacterized protein n=1 Tax=Pleurodeles waltl TaxID=8319 RepID=A0AAV7T5U5_PLEWA|nr:hypothetical protein NDU88_003186 [Pleurodeles waltl]
MTRLGNPDIRVSQSVQKEDGQRAQREEKEDGQRVQREEKEDGAVIEEGDANKQESANRKVPEDGRLDEQSASTPRGGPTEGQRSPEQRRLRHVPGGTWLKQVRSCIKNRLSALVGREKGGEDEGSRGQRGSEEDKGPLGRKDD